MQHLLVTWHLLVDDYLQTAQAGTIVNLKERKSFGISPGSDPTCDLNVRLGAGRKGVFDERDHKTAMVLLGYRLELNLSVTHLKQILPLIRSAIGARFR